MSLSAVLLLAASSLLEVELRRVEQTVASPGSLSTATARITPLGPVLRVQSGATAHWQLDLGPQVPQWISLTRGPARLQMPLSGASWSLEATPTRRGPQLLELRLQWQQPLQDGGSQGWRSTVSLKPGHWTTLARERSGEAVAAPGEISTRPLAQVNELQVRVNEVLE